MYGVYVSANGKKGFPVRDGALTVDPAGTMNIFIEWETRQNDGRFVKGARFTTNDPIRPEVNLIVEGTVTPAGDRP
jgi:hypothetical protein